MALNLYLDKLGGNIVGALADGTSLIEYHVEKNKKNQIVGSIYKGKVQNVLSGMQAAFVDVGLERNGYLSAVDTLVDKNDFKENELPTLLNLSEGDEVMVQAIKAPTGSKGVRLSNNISLAGRYVVYLPTLNFNAVSRKITDEKTRARLEKLVDGLKRKEGGFIIRTAGETAKPKDIKNEAELLIKQFADVKEKFKSASAREKVYSDGDLVMRLIRDVVTLDVEKIIIGDLEIYERLKELPKSHDKLKKKLYYFDKKTDMFTYYGLNEDVESLLHKRVNLSTGAYFIIDRNEALTVIDVNTGGFIGESHLEETVYQTNLLAAKEIARQVRLRNIGGIIVVDFIDMQDSSHREKLVEFLSEELKKDRLKCNVIGMTGLGIIEFTRTKKRKELSEFLNKTCPYCRGEGTILSNDYIVMKIRTGLLDLFLNDYTTAVIELNVDICDFILTTGALSRDKEKFWQDKNIYLIPHKTYHQEYFNLKGGSGEVLNLSDKAIKL